MEWRPHRVQRREVPSPYVTGRARPEAAGPGNRAGRGRAAGGVIARRGRLANALGASRRFISVGLKWNGVAWRRRKTGRRSVG
jgi:hypothetical protein